MKRIQTIRKKLGIPSGQALVHLVAAEIISALIWWGISKLITITWIRDFGFLVVFVAAMLGVAWYLPKLANIKLKIAPIPKRVVNRLEHDGVLWEDGGFNTWGNLNVIGPLCLKDFTPLAIKDRDKVNTYTRDDTLISNSGYHSQLVCLECKVEYTLGVNPKTIKDSRNEVGSRFEGKKRRENG
jgi:hypothetical protein